MCRFGRCIITDGVCGHTLGTNRQFGISHLIMMAQSSWVVLTIDIANYGIQRQVGNAVFLGNSVVLQSGRYKDRSVVQYCKLGDKFRLVVQYWSCGIQRHVGSVIFQTIGYRDRSKMQYFSKTRGIQRR